MIHTLCNNGHEGHIDHFYKIAVFEATQLPYFTHFTNEEIIEEILTNLPDTAQVLIADLLPNNVNVAHSTGISASGKLYRTGIGFTITPQQKEIQKVLEEYNNEEVVVLISKHGSTHLYGTTAQPLLCTYDEVNSPQPGAVKGYAVRTSGSTYAKSIIFDHINFNIYQRGLPFVLAETL